MQPCGSLVRSGAIRMLKLRLVRSVWVLDYIQRRRQGCGSSHAGLYQACTSRSAEYGISGTSFSVEYGLTHAGVRASANVHPVAARPGSHWPMPRANRV